MKMDIEEVFEILSFKDKTLRIDYLNLLEENVKLKKEKKRLQLKETETKNENKRR